MSKARDGRTALCKKLGLKHRSAEGAGVTTGRARFEDSASEEGTTGRTRVRTSCPVQESRGVSPESGYTTDTHLPKSSRITGSEKLYIEYNRPRNRSRAPQGGRQCRRHQSEEREDCATREPERAWIFPEIVGDSKVSGERKPHVF